jgi:galectin-8/galectin-9
VIRNSCFGGIWGEEQRDSPYFPFEPRKAFIICITATNDAFNVEVDGNEFITFANRNDTISNITHLSAFGSVHVSEIHMPFHDNQVLHNC